MKKNNNKGITLMALVITILILIILASIGTYSGIQVVKSAQFTAFSTELKIMQTQVNKLYEEKKNGNEYVDSLGTAISSDTDVQIQANKAFNASGITDDTSNYKYFNNDTIKSLNIEGVEGKFFVNVDKRSVVSYDGFEYKGKTYYTINQLENNSLYNVEYNENNTDSSNKPTFDLETSNINKDECLLSIKNIKYNGNITKWNLLYKLKEENEFKESKDLNIKLDKEGKYIIKLSNGNVESEEIEKNIYTSHESNYVKKHAEDFYGYYVKNYISSNDAGIKAPVGEKWQIFMADEDNIFLIASNYITRKYTGTKNNIGFDYDTANDTEETATKMWLNSMRKQYNANSTITDVPNILSNLEKQSIYHKWLNNPENQVKDYINEKAVESILDTNVWSGYNNNVYAKYAIGGPTIEMFCKAYNDSYTQFQIKAQETNTDNDYGYRIIKGTEIAQDSISGLKVGAKNEFVDNMFFKLYDNVGLYWTASPCASGTYDIIAIGNDGNIGYGYYYYTEIGFRPIVCLKSDVHLLFDENDKTYSIFD